MTQPDAEALRAGLRCRWPALRAAAEHIIADALRSADGNVSRAADLLGVSHRALCRILADSPALRTARDGARRDAGGVLPRLNTCDKSTIHSKSA